MQALAPVYGMRRRELTSVLSLLDLLVQNYQYWHQKRAVSAGTQRAGANQRATCLHEVFFFPSRTHLCAQKARVNQRAACLQDAFIL